MGKAAEAAVSLFPRLITDGDFFDNDAVVECVLDLDRDHGVRVDTIALIDKTDDNDYKRALRAIAAEGGGTFRLVRVNDPPAKYK